MTVSTRQQCILPDYLDGPLQRVFDPQRQHLTIVTNKLGSCVARVNGPERGSGRWDVLTAERNLKGGALVTRVFFSDVESEWNGAYASYTLAHNGIAYRSDRKRKTAPLAREARSNVQTQVVASLGKLETAQVYQDLLLPSGTALFGERLAAMRKIASTFGPVMQLALTKGW